MAKFGNGSVDLKQSRHYEHRLKDHAPDESLNSPAHVPIPLGMHFDGFIFPCIRIQFMTPVINAAHILQEVQSNHGPLNSYFQ